MKCTNCGCEINFESGFGVCPSCGSKHKLDNIFEKIDVCLCYTEYDDAGRRTKDSIIAQEVYNKLESKKINVFYERILVSDCLTEELELLRQAAIHNAPIIIVVGSSKENFEAFVKKSGEYFGKKRIIPFFVDINPRDIPSSLNKLQAVNYKKIGWEKDLTTGVLNILGRNDEADIENLHASSRRKLSFVLTGIALCVLLIGSVLFFSLTNPKSKNSDQPITKLQMYENATDLTEQGKLLEAAEIYSQILDFKDSQQLLDSVYAKYYSNYSGTYLTDDKKTMLSLDIKNNTSVEVLYKHNKDGDRRYYSATTTADVHIIEFDGVGKIELLDQKIKFSLNYPNDSSLNVSLEFTFEQKGDSIDYDSGIREQLLSFFDPDVYAVDYGVPFVSLEELVSLGYNFSEDGFGESIITSVLKMDYATKNSYESNIAGEVVTPNGTNSFYDYANLKNYHSAAYYSYRYNTENDIIFEFDSTGLYSQYHNVLSVFGRASLLTPDKIGEKPTDFTEKGVVYSYVGVGDVLQKDDWVNITSYNPDYLKEYNKKMEFVNKINSTDFSNEKSVFALNKYKLEECDFMLSNYKLGFNYYTYNSNGYMNNPVYEIIGTDYQVVFDFYKNGEFVNSEIFRKEK